MEVIEDTPVAAHVALTLQSDAEIASSLKLQRVPVHLIVKGSTCRCHVVGIEFIAVVSLHIPATVHVVPHLLVVDAHHLLGIIGTIQISRDVLCAIPVVGIVASPVGLVVLAAVESLHAEAVFALRTVLDEL